MTTNKNFTPTATPTFCVITPTAYLNAYATQTSKHLVLAHLVDQDPVYAAFYRERSALGDGIIMDNGAFELGESYAPDKLADLGRLCGADVVVLPDYPGDASEKTIVAAEKYIPYFKAEGFKTMFVPQSKTDDMEDWIDGYVWAARHPDIDVIGMSILGVPNAITHIPAAYARVVMTQVLVDRGFFSPKYHHYLGLNAGPALELPTLIRMGALHSCDSSGPVWAGILGHEYNLNCDSYLPVSKVKAHVQFDYNAKLDEQTHRRIQHNII